GACRRRKPTRHRCRGSGSAARWGADAGLSFSHIPFDVVLARDRAPDAHLLGQEFALFFRPGKHQRDLLSIGELLGDALLAQTSGELGAKALDNRLRRAGGGGDAPPGISFEAREATLAHRRYVG